MNGQPIRRSFKKDIGFVDQHDMLLPTMTVMESLMFSALLRLPRSVSLKEKVGVACASYAKASRPSCPTHPRAFLSLPFSRFSVC